MLCHKFPPVEYINIKSSGLPRNGGMTKKGLNFSLLSKNTKLSVKQKYYDME